MSKGSFSCQTDPGPITDDSMKNTLLLIAFLVISSFAKAGTLSLTFVDTKQKRGTVYFAVYNKSSEFPKGRIFAEGSVASNGQNEIETSIELPDGEYAISTFLDENRNKKLDQNLVGIPTERFGFSQNPKILTGPPSYAKCAFLVSGNSELKIKLITLLDQKSFAFIQTEAPHYDKYPATPAVPYEGTTLDFYSRSKPYGEFSNFALFPVFVDGEWWPTSEHYYQAQKYLTRELQAWVQAASTPEEAAARGRDTTHPKREDWDEYRNEVMEKAVWDKITRYESLKTLLLSTGDARLVEHTENDCYWGDCGDRTGQNKLGLLLEKIREKLKEQK